jgi:hypothetical protein
MVAAAYEDFLHYGKAGLPATRPAAWISRNQDSSENGRPGVLT